MTQIVSSPQECLVCYQYSTQFINFPGCNHPPKLCSECANEMELLKCIINCPDSKSFTLDLCCKYFNPINNIKKIEINKIHQHTLLWNDKVRFKCDICNIKGSNVIFAIYMILLFALIVFKTYFLLRNLGRRLYNTILISSIT